MPCNYDLLIIGDAVVDISLNIKNFPIMAGTTHISEDMEIYPGGPAAMAIIASRLGLKVAFADKIGTDIIGDHLVKELEASGVNTEHIIRENGMSTATSINVVDSMKNHSFLGYLGAGTMLDSIDNKLISDSKSIFFEGYNLVHTGRTYYTILDTARKANLQKKQVFFDVGPLISEIVGLDLFIDYSSTVFLNRDEAMAYSKMNLENTIAMLGKKGNADYILKLDREGSVIIKNKQTIPCMALKTYGIKNTIGAGDAFDAGYIAALLSGYKEEIACMAGNMVASLRISSCIRSIPPINEIIGRIIP
ncbi:MAG: carbohydrate kinase family protein [Ferroplasma sp.]|uniref:carbohydrate kinase family protein n=1 Tax=Ferroplasma sp. TaxID=2591003 RepID=UPI00281692BC|nr:carbohydrate kinase family protein [Ferroplasma sp.]WMT51563.1 MAG: carbohydrate kinase family protein [Ferroplasma sp.]